MGRVASIDRRVENLAAKTQAEIEKLGADFEAQIAVLDAERIQVAGEADAEVKSLKETAKSSLYKLKMDVFKNDNDAFMRYTLAQQLNPNMILRLFHSGPGTFWTNMDGKGPQLLISPPGGQPAPKPVPRNPTPVRATSK